MKERMGKEETRGTRYLRAVAGNRMKRHGNNKDISGVQRITGINIIAKYIEISE
jgi:hypothetical protein